MVGNYEPIRDVLRGLLNWLFPGEPYQERAAFPRSIAVRVDRPVMFENDSVGYAEAEPRSNSGFFCRVERFEQIHDVLRCHSVSVVGDRKNDSVGQLFDLNLYGSARLCCL